MSTALADTVATGPLLPAAVLPPTPPCCLPPGAARLPPAAADAGSPPGPSPKHRGVLPPASMLCPGSKGPRRGVVKDAAMPLGVNCSAEALNAEGAWVTLPPPRCLEAEGKFRLPPPPPPVRESLRIMDMPDAAWSLEPCTSMAGCCLAAEDRKREATCKERGRARDMN